MSGKSRQSLKAALEAHESRYNLDLAYLMNRLDKMDQIINEQDKLIARLGLRLFDLESVDNLSKMTDWPREENGDCQIIQFSDWK